MRLDDDWIYEEEEMKNDERRRRNQAASMMSVCVAAIVCVVAMLVLFCLRVDSFDLRMQAAFNQGYYGVDRRTALEMAAQGIGRDLFE